MRLVSYFEPKQAGSGPTGVARAGVLVGTEVIDVARAWQGMREQYSERAPELPSTVQGLLASGVDALAGAAEAASWAQASRERASGALQPIAKLRLAAPVPRPGKIVCVGLNYLDHIHEVGRPVPEAPTLFAKPPSAVIGSGVAIEKPAMTKELDHEVELAVIIGRRARRLSPHEARSAVAGYTVLNDVSARDMQRRTNQWFTGKAFDTTCPMGPALVTPDEAPDPHSLDIRCYVNGRLRQSSNTRHLLFDVDYLVSYVSAIMTLEPGDVIATGTPGGVALGQPEPQWLRPGDTVRCEIDGIGMLENPVVADPADADTEASSETSVGP